MASVVAPHRRRIDAFHKAGDDPEALQPSLTVGLEAIQAYCLPFMSFARCPPVTMASGQTSKDPGRRGPIKGRRHQGQRWRPLATDVVRVSRDIQLVMEVNDHGNVDALQTAGETRSGCTSCALCKLYL